MGQYDCRNKNVIRQHLDWCKQYGLDLWVCSWWGVNSIEDITIKNYIKPELKADDVKFAIFYESFLLGEPPWIINSLMETRLKTDFDRINMTGWSPTSRKIAISTNKENEPLNAMQSISK